MLGRASCSPASATTGATGPRNRLPGFGDLVEQRHRSSGDVAYALEPDLKEGRGGSRDVAALRALARVADVYVPDERLAAAVGTLFDAARRAAAPAPAGPTGCCSSTRTTSPLRWGLGDADELMVMVSGAARTIALAIRRRVARGAGRGSQGPRGRSAAGRDVPLSPGLVLRDGEVALVADASPADDPAFVLRAAADAAYLGVPIARPTLRRFDAERGTVHDPWAPETARGLRRAARRRRSPWSRQFEVLDEHGLLVQFLPEWDVVRCPPAAERVPPLHGRSSPPRGGRRRRRSRAPGRAGPTSCSWARCCTTWARGSRRPHRPRCGAGRACGDRAWGSIRPTSAVLVDLVRWHLLLPSYATGRDLGDPATVDAVVDAVGTEETLDLLAGADRGRLARHRPDRMEHRGRPRLVVRLVSLARSELRRRAGFAVREQPVPDGPDRGWPRSTGRSPSTRTPAG